MLKLVGQEDKADRPVHGFSGGERQRLGIAQAEVTYPDLLILDGPPAVVRKDHGAAALPRLDQAVGLHFLIGGPHGVEVDAEAGGELADRRKLVALPKASTDDQPGELFMELSGKRGTAAWIDAEHALKRGVHWMG